MKRATRIGVTGRTKAASLLVVTISLLGAAAWAAPRPTLEVTPRNAQPGDPLLITVRGMFADGVVPVARVGEAEVTLHAVRGGFQGLGAVDGPVTAEGSIEVRVTTGEHALSRSVPVRARVVKEVELEVPEEHVDPPADVRKVIERDREAIAIAWGRGTVNWQLERPFVWPRPQRFTSRYGERRMFNGTLNSEHQGLDLLGKIGDPVRAANDGTVVFSGDLFQSGKTVLVDHGGGIFTGYFHLSGLDVLEGDTVKRGQPVGQVGDTGRTTGPHLHFAVRVGGRYVDPEAFMRLRLRPARGEPSGEVGALGTKP